ncbi:MAG: hypothetical protein ABFC24_10255 [Methanoregulaceae archaeon]
MYPGKNTIPHAFAGSFVFLLLAAGLATVFLVPSVLAATSGGQEIIYQEDFSASPDWTTNSPSRYYWDSASQTYHYKIEPGTGSYAYHEVPWNDTSFTLEYDVTPVTTMDDTAFRLGIGKKDMNYEKGPCVVTSFLNDKHGNMMGLRVITPQSHMFDYTSWAYSYGGENAKYPTVTFTSNQTYHVRVKYDQDQQTVSMTVTKQPSGSQVWTYFIKTGSDLHDLERVYLTSIGDFSGGVNYAEGTIDNVVLSAPVTATPTQTVATTIPMSAAATKKPVSATATASPTPAATQSPVSPLAAITGIGAAALVSAFLLAGKRQ